MRSPDPAQLADQLRGVLEPVVHGAGLEIDAVEVRSAGRRHSVKLVVDLPSPRPRPASTSTSSPGSAVPRPPSWTRTSTSSRVRTRSR